MRRLLLPSPLLRPHRPQILFTMDVPTCISTIQQWLIKDDTTSPSPLYTLLDKFHVQVVTNPPTLPSSSPPPSSSTLSSTSSVSFSSSSSSSSVASIASPTNPHTITGSSSLSLTPPTPFPSTALTDDQHSWAPSLSTTTDNKPLLYIICEESHQTSQPVDHLGRTGQLTGRGYYEAPPSMIHILTDRCTTSSSSSQTVSNDLENLLQHELVHALDHSIYHIDIQTCGGLGCSEIRAAKAAECSKVWPEWLRKRCIKSIASTSTNMVFPDYGSRCVDAVFSLCSETATTTNLKVPLEELIKNSSSHA